MDKLEFLKQVQFYKNAIDVYAGPDPLQPRYEYLMWLEKNVGKENYDFNTCLEQTLQMFQSYAHYTNDTRYVELLVLFARFKGDRIKYYEKLFQCELGSNCSIFYKAWSDEYITRRCFLQAFETLNQGLQAGAQPQQLLKDAIRDIEAYIGRRVLRGNFSCEQLNIPCNCIGGNSIIKKEINEAVKNWELNPLKPGEPDDFTCPYVVPDPEDPNKIPMYAKNLVYCGESEYQLEEVMAFKYLKKLEQARALKVCKSPMVVHMETPGTSPNRPPSPSSNDHSQAPNEVSAAAQSFTAHTKVAYNLIQNMWTSPDNHPPLFSQPKDGFKAPEVPKPAAATPFTVFKDDSMRGLNENENSAHPRGSTSQKPQKGLSERKALELKVAESRLGGGAKHQLMFGSTAQGPSKLEEDDLAMNLDPHTPYNTNKPPVPTDWNLEDVTCNTKVFNNFLGMSSTPNMKGLGRDNFGNVIQNNHLSHTVQKGDTTALSVILEASKETPGSGSSGNENRPPNILEVEKTMENLDISTSNPFSSKLLENLLLRVNYPYNFDPQLLHHYHVVNSSLPPITKSLKLGDKVFSMTGETVKGAYAKVLKAVCNEKTYALKIEKPACHWEFYICKEILKRVKTENVKYFADISSAHFFQNGSIFVSDWARYGTLLNVINQNKLVSKSMDPLIALFLCIEVMSAVHFMHSQCNIIHADIKPDNFVVHSLPNMNPSGPYVQMIDFGRSIDMTLMPRSCRFTTVVTTDGFQCNEMKENRPWTYQTDLYGLAGTLYCILVGDYMKVIKKKEVYVLSKPLSRSYQGLWDPIFKNLLNIESCDTLPDLHEMKLSLENTYNSYDSFSIKQSFNALTNVLHGK